MNDSAAGEEDDDDQQKNTADVVAEAKKKPNAVVVLGSAANPPHEGHLHCVRVGVRKAEELGYNVAFSTIAIAPFGYVRRKMDHMVVVTDGGNVHDSTNNDNNNKVVLDDTSRLRLLQLMTTASTPKSTDGLRFRCPDRCYGSALECARHLLPQKEDDTMVFLVVGGDRAKSKWRKKKKQSNFSAICCARSDDQLKQLQHQFQADVNDENQTVDPQYYFATGIGPSTSSTEIRGLLEVYKDDREFLMERLCEKGYPKDAASYLVECVLGP